MTDELGVVARHSTRRVTEGNEDGYSVLEAAITLPIMLLLLMIVVQWAIVWHSRNVAQAAAQEVLRTASAYRSTAAAGRLDGVNYVHQVAPHALACDVLTVHRSTRYVTVHIHCAVMSVIPFGRFSADETVSGPVEAYVAS